MNTTTSRATKHLLSEAAERAEISFDPPSTYIPAGASFNGCGALGVEAWIAAADAAGMEWSAAVEVMGDITWEQLEERVHCRKVSGQAVYGLRLEAAEREALAELHRAAVRRAAAWAVAHSEPRSMKPVYVDWRTVGSAFGCVGVVRHRRNGRVVAETDRVYPYGFVESALAGAERLAKQRGWQVVDAPKARR
jgi:hypothetical protein